VGINMLSFKSKQLGYPKGVFNMDRKIMDVTNKADKLKFNPNRKLTLQDITRPFQFLVKEEIGSGFRDVLFAHNLKSYKTLDEGMKIFKEKYEDFEKSENIDNKKYQLVVIDVYNRKQLDIEGITQKQITEWVKKLNIPEK